MTKIYNTLEKGKHYHAPSDVNPTSNYFTTSGVEYPIVDDEYINADIEIVAEEDKLPPAITNLTDDRDQHVSSVHLCDVPSQQGCQRIHKVHNDKLSIFQLNDRMTINAIAQYSFCKSSSSKPFRLYSVEPYSDKLERTTVNLGHDRTNMIMEETLQRMYNFSAKYNVMTIKEPFMSMIGDRHMCSLLSPNKNGSFDQNERLGGMIDISNKHGNIVIQTVVTNSENRSIMDGGLSSVRNNDLHLDEVIELVIPIDEVGPGIYCVIGFNLSFVVLPDSYTPDDIAGITKIIKENKINSIEDMMLYQLSNNFVFGMNGQIKGVVKTSDRSMANKTVFGSIGGYPFPIKTEFRKEARKGIHVDRVTVVVEDPNFVNGLTEVKKYIRIEFEHDSIVKGHIGTKLLGSSPICVGLDKEKVDAACKEVVVDRYFENELGDIGITSIDEVRERFGKLNAYESDLSTLSSKLEAVEKDKQSLFEENVKLQTEVDHLKKYSSDTTSYIRSEAARVKASADVSKATITTVESEYKMYLGIAGVVIGILALAKLLAK